MNGSSFWGMACVLIATQSATANDAFGPEAHGIRCRIATVSPDTDDEAPDFLALSDEYTSRQDLTFCIELKNVSDKTITLLGVRYGDSYPTAKGKLNTNFLAPHLFDIQFVDDEGKSVPRAERHFVSQMLVLHGASAHEIESGDSLRILLRPSKFNSPMDYTLGPGKYRATIRYRGPSEEVRDQITKHWPDLAQGKAWAHKVTSNPVAFSIRHDGDESGQSDLAWGPEKDGLKAAIEVKLPSYVTEKPSVPPGIAVKTPAQVIFHVKNVSDMPITFVSETSRQGDTALVFDAQGEKVQARGTFFTGWPVDVRWNLKPGDVAQLNVLSPAINSITEPGEYTFAYDIRFNNRVSRDKDGNQTFPAKDDWQDVLRTGEIPLVLRKRTIEDDDRAKPPSFIGKLKFEGQNGEAVESGAFTFRGQIKNRYHSNRLLKPGTLTIPDCTSKPATVTVRADGFEQAVFYDVKFKDRETTVLKLKKAEPATLRLVHSVSGEPIVGATVRYFNQTSAKAGSGPYPTDGLKGAVWTTSEEDGTVTLTSLQKINPYYEKLGDALYHFYIEPADEALAPCFVGPVKAGQKLGDVTIGSFVELRGEVRGTAEELRRFAAEWDQPYVQKSENPDATWLYAQSKRLRTETDGEKLTFHLTELRPDKLRIIANFGPHPHSVKHVYSRREVGENDVLVEVDLSEEVGDLVITAKGRKQSPDK